MSRPNRPRSIAGETSLARRIGYERETRGMSYEGLASRMTAAGCAINGSGVYKSEKLGRRITVDELVAYSMVFRIPVAELLLPPEAAASRALADLIAHWDKASQEAARAQDQEREAWQKLTEYATRPDVADSVETVVGAWADRRFDPATYPAARPYWMRRVTGSPEWQTRYLEAEGLSALDKEGDDDGVDPEAS